VSSRTVAVLLAAAVASATPLRAADARKPDPPGPVRLYVRAAFAAGSPTFRETRPFTEFAETGHIDSRYTEDPGPGFEAGLLWRFAPRLGVMGAVSATRRREAGSFSAALPHPLFFGAPRLASGDFSGRREQETAVHLDLALLASAGRLQWIAFAGPSLVGVQAELVRAVEYAQSYPYDTVTVTGTPFASSNGRAVGFNVGAGVDFRLARHVALATQVRWSRATVHLDAAPDDRVGVTAGGLHVAAGLGLDF
jgi:opacity protein-like surface antigen